MCTLPMTRLVLVIIGSSILNSFADVNSWLKPASGNWEEPQWSAGVLPNSGHAVMITNAGWKAVQIAPSTAQNFPGSLNVYSITVSSPVDSYNTLLLNYVGFDRPLTVNYSLTVDSGSTMSLFSSALRLAGPTGVGLSIGGEFNQNDSSQVTGNQADVGWVGPGVYNFNSGLVQLQHLWVGGPNNGVFNQNGGSNAPGILHFEGGTYNLRDGDFNGTTYFSGNAQLCQDGGRVHSIVEVTRPGQYVLNGGINYGGVTLMAARPADPGGRAIQNGGTNLGPISVGSYSGGGSYIISNGVISSPSISLGMFGGFHQAGGIVTTPATISLSHGTYNRGLTGSSAFRLDRGFLSSTGIRMDLSSFRHDGGTNQIAGDLTLVGTWYGTTSYALTGGLLVTENAVLAGALQGGFFQAGGTHRVANTLNIMNSSYNYYWRGYELSGGQLIISNLSVFLGGVFRQTGGTVTQSGTLTLDNASLFAGPGTQQFGALQLAGIDKTNGLTMPSNACVLRFRNSSAIGWAEGATLIIDNYSGSYLGGGTQRIIFGNNASALTAQQLAKIFFRNPADLAFGLHPAKILPSGEIVPDGVPPTGHNPSRVALRKLPDSTVQTTVTGDPGYDYAVLTSTDLINWNFWTNRVATNGSFSVIDPQRTQDWPYRRFYKAVLMR